MKKFKRRISRSSYDTFLAYAIALVIFVGLLAGLLFLGFLVTWGIVAGICWCFQIVSPWPLWRLSLGIYLVWLLLSSIFSNNRKGSD